MAQKMNNHFTENHASLFITVLLPLIAFFSCWGSGTQNLTNHDLSKIFVGLIIVLILHWLFFTKNRLQFPRWVTLFVAFSFIHTAVTYGILFPEELGFGYTGIVHLNENFSSMQESLLFVISRFFLFILFGYAIAREINNKQQISTFAIFYGLGLLFIHLTGGYETQDKENIEIRQAGGFLNANAFGLSGLTAIFLGLVGFTITKSQFAKTLSVVTIATGIMALIASASRGNIIGALAGILILIFFSRLKQMMKFALFSIAVLTTILLFAPGKYTQTVMTRFEHDKLTEGGGSGRTGIWKDYLDNLSKYFVIGVGQGRSITVIEDNWTEKYAVTHNTYLQILVEYGLPGLCLLIAALTALFKMLKKIEEPQLRIHALAALTAWTVSVTFGNRLTARDTWILLGILVATAKISAKKLPLEKF
ncbi:MAG: O-antigen ligase family protein [Elusimicrobiaceae bacterium]